jgi:hypothetical protein
VQITPLCGRHTESGPANASALPTIRTCSTSQVGDSDRLKRTPASRRSALPKNAVAIRVMPSETSPVSRPVHGGPVRSGSHALVGPAVEGTAPHSGAPVAGVGWHAYSALGVAATSRSMLTAG